MSQQFAQRMDLLQTESAFQILSRAKELEAQGREIIHLEIGQPDFATPSNIIEAAHRAMQDGYTGYTPSSGLPEVRDSIARYCERHKGVRTSVDEIVVVPGGKPIMFYTMLMLVNPGDEVIYPNPGFPIYESVIRFAGGVPVPMPILENNDFRIDIDRLEQSITSKTKLIILNSPANPTGGLLTPDDIERIANMLRDKDIYVLSDEIYDRIVYEGEVVSIATYPFMKDRTIILDCLSKSYAMTGWRLGYGVMHKDLAQRMDLLMVNSNSCAAAFTQRAVIEALEGPQDAVDEMVVAFKERRDYLVGALNAIDGVRCATPKGAFYAFPHIGSFGLSSDEFADRLLTEGGVATASGSSFGEYGEGHIRLSYANSLDNIKKAVDWLAKFTKTL